MPVKLDCEFRRTKASPRINALGCGNQALLVWYYCGVLKNTNDQFQPFAKVAFRVQLSDKSFSDSFVYRNVPIEHLGQLRIGSLCKKNRIISRAQFEEKEFSVLHEKGTFWFESFHSAAEKGFSPPYPQQIYPLHFQRDRNCLVGFKLHSGGTLVIPTLEYFTRYYGRSGKLRRYLTTLKWEVPGGLPGAFFNPLGQPEEPGTWKINLKKGFYNSDALFLAHLKYDCYTQRVVKLISSEIEVQYKGDRIIPAFPKIGPWFRGSGTLLVRGIPFNGGNSFLGLQITGLSDPAGGEIERLLDNRNNAANPAGSEAEGKAWAGAPVRRPNQPPEIIDLTAYEAPDQGSAILELEDPDIKILGPRRQVTSFRDIQARDKGGEPSRSGEVDTYSSGEPHGGGKGVDQVSIHTPELIQPEMETEGVLRDIWNAAQRLNKLYKKVSCVEWYTPSNGFNNNDEPQLMALRPYQSDETFDGAPIPAKTRKWLFLDPDTQKKVRGILVIRLTIHRKYIYIIETQRRVRTVIDEHGRITDKEESLRGMVFTLDSEEDLNHWIKVVRSNIRRVEGVVVNLTTLCPGESDVFKHKPASTEEVPCWATLLNALKKVGILVN